MKRGVEINNTGPVNDGPTIEGEVAKATIPHCGRTWGGKGLSLDKGIFTQRSSMLQRQVLRYCKP